MGKTFQRKDAKTQRGEPHQRIEQEQTEETEGGKLCQKCAIPGNSTTARRAANQIWNQEGICRKKAQRRRAASRNPKDFEQKHTKEQENPDSESGTENFAKNAQFPEIAPRRRSGRYNDSDFRGSPARQPCRPQESHAARRARLCHTHAPEVALGTLRSALKLAGVSPEESRMLCDCDRRQSALQRCNPSESCVP